MWIFPNIGESGSCSAFIPVILPSSEPPKFQQLLKKTLF